MATVILVAFLVYLGFNSISANVNQQTTINQNNISYGANDWTFNESATSKMKQAGTNSAIVLVPWNHIEPVENEFHFGQDASRNSNYDTDSNVNNAYNAGLEVILNIYDAPSWALGKNQTSLPDKTKFADFTKKVMDHYDGKFSAIQILDEDSNLAGWPNNLGERDTQYYSEILKAVYPVIKAQNTNIKVVLQAAWSNPQGWFNDLYQLGAKDYFDVANIHYYKSGSSKDDPKVNPANSFSGEIAWDRLVMDQNGDFAKPIWITEFNYSLTDEGGQDKNSIVSPNHLQEYFNYILSASLKSGFIEKIYPYVWQANDGMALVHGTDGYGYANYPQGTSPKLAQSIDQNATSLSISGDWTDKYPIPDNFQDDYLMIDDEAISYGQVSYNPTSNITTFANLSRGIQSTTAAAHSADSSINHKMLTADYQTPAYQDYAKFIAQHPVFDKKDANVLPDIPTPTTSGIEISNPSFDQQLNSWQTLTKDSCRYYNVASDIYHSVSNEDPAHPTAAKLSFNGIDGRDTNNYNCNGQASTPTIILRNEIQGSIPSGSYLVKAQVKAEPGSSKEGFWTMLNYATLSDAQTWTSQGPSNYYLNDTNDSWRTVSYPLNIPAGTTKIWLEFSTFDIGTAYLDNVSILPLNLNQASVRIENTDNLSFRQTDYNSADKQASFLIQPSSGINPTQMSFSVDTINWTNWENYNSKPTVALATIPNNNANSNQIYVKMIGQNNRIYAAYGTALAQGNSPSLTPTIPAKKISQSPINSSSQNHPNNGLISRALSFLPSTGGPAGNPNPKQTPTPTANPPKSPKKEDSSANYWILALTILASIALLIWLHYKEKKKKQSA